MGKYITFVFGVMFFITILFLGGCGGSGRGSNSVSYHQGYYGGYYSKSSNHYYHKNRPSKPPGDRPPNVRPPGNRPPSMGRPSTRPSGGRRR